MDNVLRKKEKNAKRNDSSYIIAELRARRAEHHS